jgi:hypothetical protein
MNSGNTADTAYNVVVTLNGQNATRACSSAAACQFTYEAAKTVNMTSVTPNSGAVGADFMLTITGTNFDTTPANNKVYLERVPGEWTQSPRPSFTSWFNRPTVK